MSHSAREVERLKGEEAKGEHPIRVRAPKEGTYEWVNPKTGEIMTVPNGIDPGWAYNPGKTSWKEA